MGYKKKLITGLIYILLFALLSCGKDGYKNTDCDAIVETEKENLIIFAPIEAIYNKGDIINIKLTIPNLNNFSGVTPINIYAISSASFAELIISMYATNDLFTGNNITFVSGTHSNEYLKTGQIGKFYFPLNLNTNNYEFEANITLNRLGNYKIPSLAYDYIVFQGKDFCKRIILKTNKAGGNASGNIEFVVQ